MASRISMRSSRARVTAMVGRMSRPSAISVLNALRDQMAPRVERDDAPRLRPLRERPDGRGRIGVGQVGAADRVERAGRDRERAIERIGAAMGADDVAVLEPRHRADDRSALARRGRAPMNRKARLAARLRMGGQADVIGAVGRHVRPVRKPGPPARRRCVAWGIAKLRERLPGKPRRTCSPANIAGMHSPANGIEYPPPGSIPRKDHLAASGRGWC